MGGGTRGNRATSLFWPFPRLSLSLLLLPPIIRLLCSRCLLYLGLFHIKFFCCRLNFWLLIEGDAVELGKLQLVGLQPGLQHLQAHGGAHGDCDRLLAHHHWCSSLVRSLSGVKGRLGGLEFSPVQSPISRLLFPLSASLPLSPGCSLGLKPAQAFLRLSFCLCSRGAAGNIVSIIVNANVLRSFLLLTLETLRMASRT